MTNFSGSTQSRSFQWLSPERAVLVVPLFAGLALGGLVLMGLVLPSSVRLKQQQEELDVVVLKSESVPVLELQLQQLKLKQQQRQQQQKRLLSLVAGTSELSTFLAELNDLALQHQVVIAATEPGPITRFVPPPPPQEANPDTPPESAGATKVAPAPQDGLLSPAVEKRSAQLKVVGLFPAVNSFLQALERLQVFVVISDLNVNQGLHSQSGANMAAIPKEAPVVTMTLTATAYGRVNAPVASAVQP